MDKSLIVQQIRDLFTQNAKTEPTLSTVDVSKIFAEIDEEKSIDQRVDAILHILQDALGEKEA